MTEGNEREVSMKNKESCESADTKQTVQLVSGSDRFKLNSAEVKDDDVYQLPELFNLIVQR